MDITLLSTSQKVSYIIMVFTTIFIILHTATVNLTLKKHVLPKNIINLFISIVYSFYISISDIYLLKFESSIMVALRGFLQIVLFCILLKQFFIDPISKIIATITISATINLISSVTAYIFLVMIFSDLDVYKYLYGYKPSNYDLIVFIIIISIMFILSFFIRSFLKKIPNDVPTKYWTYLSVVEFSLILVSMFYFNDINVTPNLSMFFTFLFLLCAGIVTAIMFITITKYYTEEKNHLLMQTQNQALMAELNSENIRNEKLKSFKHEVNSLLTSIYILSQNNETNKITDLVSEKIETLKQNDQKVLTSNIFIDSILNLKLKQINDLNIPITTELAYLNLELPFIASDLSSVLMNLIENSIDASKIVIKNNGTPHIFLKLCIYKNNFSIIIKNNYIGNIKKQDNIILTSKDDSSFHGYGLKNAEQIIKKYNGLFSYDNKDNIFTVKAMLPLQSQKA